MKRMATVLMVLAAVVMLVVPMSPAGAEQISYPNWCETRGYVFDLETYREASTTKRVGRQLVVTETIGIRFSIYTPVQNEWGGEYLVYVTSFYSVAPEHGMALAKANGDGAVFVQSQGKCPRDGGSIGDPVSVRLIDDVGFVKPDGVYQEWTPPSPPEVK